VSGALPDSLRLGPVHLTVTDVDRSVGFYQDAIGLSLHHREDSRAAMGAGEEDLVVLHGSPFAREPGRTAGLYHFALLHPSREELGRALMRLTAAGARVEGASDHGISEAIYLPDPDGNGIELAADRPRHEWTARWDVNPEPLDLRSLIAPLATEPTRRRADAALKVGHLHLHVGDIEHALAFYRDVIGFDVQVLLPTAAFVSAGGYHHHLGFNVWRGANVPPAPSGAIGLREWTVVLRDPRDVTARLEQAGLPHEDGLTADPWGNRVRFVSAR
jgi:catechol 2,3-dioxygenase